MSLTSDSVELSALLGKVEKWPRAWTGLEPSSVGVSLEAGPIQAILALRQERSLGEWPGAGAGWKSGATAACLGLGP